MDENKARIRQFVARFIPNHTLQDHDDLFATGLNSLFAMQLVHFVEKEFGVAVENEDLDLDNFRSINALVDFISRKNSIA